MALLCRVIFGRWKKNGIHNRGWDGTLVRRVRAVPCGSRIMQGRGEGDFKSGLAIKHVGGKYHRIFA